MNLAIHFTAKEIRDMANENIFNIAKLEVEIMQSMVNAAKHGKYHCKFPVINNDIYFHQIVNSLKEKGFTVSKDEDNKFVINW